MANPFPANFEGLDGSRRLTGQVNFTDPANQPGGSQPVTCFLRAPSFAVATQADHDAKWTQLLDDPWNANPLAAIPTGLGMTFAFNGSDATITTTVAGVWALTFFASTPPDATFAGSLKDSFDAEVALTVRSVGDAFYAGIGAVYSMPSGAVLIPQVSTATAATGVLTATVTLVIVRLA